jgi:undecaprenyl-phosphate galactose phosphotransferase
MLVLCLPLFALVCVLVKLDGGPILYAHERVGALGKRFKCLKFRTMVTDGDTVLTEFFVRNPLAEREWRTTQKLMQDPRITRFGRILRATSIDELPQIINVIRNDMSFVGPRPITVSEVNRYGVWIHTYYSAKPGITGLWQISGRSNTTYERRVELDVQYIEGWSVARDLMIMVKTIPAVLSRSGAV